MTVETEVANLTTAVDGLTAAVNVSKATLDASVADAESAQTGAQSARDTANLHKLAAEAAATSATNTAAALTGFDLAAIATTKAVTAVDVFVYDTSKDSDGGAWRKRTQGTSWYNETLNTATRGARREFPAVAVIVAEAAKVTIYDGDDPALPMWMVFDRSGGLASDSNIFSGIANITCVTMLNGVLAAGQENTSAAGRGGLRKISFLADNAYLHYTNAVYGNYKGDISLRNAASNYGAGTSNGIIVNLGINGVAMTVLPNAPIDPATGLPVPTIAVATAGGVSVIKDDGTVVDSSLTTAFSSANFYSNVLWVDHSASSSNRLKTYLVSDLTSDGFVDAGTVFRDFDAGQLSGQTSVLCDPGPALSLAGNSMGSDIGLTFVQEDFPTPANSMVAYTTSTYNTGWMNGNIKGAFLSDTSATALVGSGELVTNGTFDTDTSGWTAGNSATLSLSSNALKVEYNGVANPFAYQVITTVIGKTYVLSFSVAGLTAGEDLRVIAGEESTDITPSSALITETGNYSLTFTATTTTTYVKLQALVNEATEFATFDNISVKLADADRSVNNKGLIVNGTVTRSPVATGADLVAYSGFSASNHLQQPYNSALDFGTNDFSVMGWVKVATAGSGQKIFFHRCDSALASGLIEVRKLSGDTIRVYVGNAGYSGSSLLETTATLPTSWSFVSFVRRSGILAVSINGGNEQTSAGANNVSNTSAAVSFGVRYSDGLLPFDNAGGGLALWRISATAPTAEQIAKIYNDEKVLFQENAQATLYGTSDAVTALAHDDATNLLHVGTSAGRSVFQGLRRVENTTTAVGTAISAANNMIVEE